MTSRSERSHAVARARRVVIKIGTRVLTHDDGSLALTRLFAVIEQIARAQRRGRTCLLVSSGALGLGRQALGLSKLPEALNERQALAAIGQSRLMGLYEQGFSRLGLVCAQVLLTRRDLDDRERYLNLRRTLGALLERGVVPVINENDAVSADELRFVPGDGPAVFSDNDRLSALLASKLGAELLILLSDVEGLFESDPHRDPHAVLIPEVRDFAELDAAVGGAGFEGARGGMRSKLEAAEIATRCGCHAVIASGRRLDTIDRVLAGEPIGTWVPARADLPARERWIAFAAAPRGALVLDRGAIEALTQRGASVLAAGVLAVHGAFERGDVIALRDEQGRSIGRGLAACDAETAKRWRRGLKPPAARNRHALVDRNHLVLEPTRADPTARKESTNG